MCFLQKPASYRRASFARLRIWISINFPIFRLTSMPNLATSSSSPFYRWWHLAPPDILFRLASLTVLNLVLYWMPIYYWTTYQSCGDDRDGGVLFPSMVLCPLSWILGGFCY